MKKVIKAASAEDKLNQFIDFHEDDDNWANNESGFDKAYEILDKYGSEDEPADEVFKRATPEDQDRILELITPGVKYGQEGYCKQMYSKAEGKKFDDKSYGDGVKDAFDAMVAEGIVYKSEFT